MKADTISAQESAIRLEAGRVVSEVRDTRKLLVTCLRDFPDLRMPSADAGNSTMVMIKFDVFDRSTVALQQYTESEASLRKRCKIVDQ